MEQSQQEPHDAILNWYQQALPDVRAGKNLDLRLAQATGMVEELDKKINQGKETSEVTTGWEELKNELCWLIWQIKEHPNWTSKDEEPQLVIPSQQVHLVDWLLLATFFRFIYL